MQAHSGEKGKGISSKERAVGPSTTIPPTVKQLLGVRAIMNSLPGLSNHDEKENQRVKQLQPSAGSHPLALPSSRLKWIKLSFFGSLPKRNSRERGLPFFLASSGSPWHAGAPWGWRCPAPGCRWCGAEGRGRWSCCAGCGEHHARAAGRWSVGKSEVLLACCSVMSLTISWPLGLRRHRGEVSRIDLLFLREEVRIIGNGPPQKQAYCFSPILHFE